MLCTFQATNIHKRPPTLLSRWSQYCHNKSGNQNEPWWTRLEYAYNHANEIIYNVMAYTMIIGKLTDKLFMFTQNNKYASHCCQVKALNVQGTHTHTHELRTTSEGFHVCPRAIKSCLPCVYPWHQALDKMYQALLHKTVNSCILPAHILVSQWIQTYQSMSRGQLPAVWKI